MKTPINNRSSGSRLSKEAEAQILENVLTRCGRGLNTIPLEELRSYSGYRSERYSLLRAFIIIILISFLLLPLLFLPPTLEVRERTDTSENRRAYNVTVNTLIPIKTVTAEMNGDTVPIYEAAGKEYIIIPNSNGEIHVTVTLLNRQVSDTFINVTGIDITAPTVIGSDYDDDYVYIYLSDDSKIDGDSLKLLPGNGSLQSSAVFDPDEDRIVVAYPDEDTLLSISDIYGNERQIELNTQK